ncbi:MAG: hypothetical protein QJR09_08110 [Micrococcus sp.]|nr:hypothetical protein [Micrococcus sp.]
MSTDARQWLQEALDRATWATDGPWAPWLDQDGTKHMNGMLMVGNEAGVIPDGETFIEDAEVNPVAHTYTPEDRVFIAHARTEHPAMAAALTAVLDLHRNEGGECTECIDWDSDPGELDAETWPCDTVRAITDHLPGDTR